MKETTGHLPRTTPHPAPLSGYMEIDHGGFELGMAEILLNHPDIETGLQQVSGAGMSKGMNGNSSLFDARGEFSLPESALHTVYSHGIVEEGCCVMASALEPCFKSK